MEHKQEILQKLKSRQQELVDQAIEEIRANDDFSIVPELVETLLHASDAYLIARLTTLLADVKETGLTTLLAERLASAGREEGRANLLRVCWESALDFSGHLEVFVNLLLDEDFVTALEASTVIENLNGDIPAGRREEAIRFLESAETREGQAFLVEGVIRHLAGWEEEE
ncbi:MAG: hypothetical protein LBK12_01490 [Odoribacteraceae bacterium]|jgi:hypothetical protein|nr:hypothetical protein [Odoribacteraceae bacterium]